MSPAHLSPTQSTDRAALLSLRNHRPRREWDRGTVFGTHVSRGKAMDGYWSPMRRKRLGGYGVSVDGRREMPSVQPFARTGLPGSGFQLANGLRRRSKTGNISHRCGDSEPCEAQNLVSGALNTRCWQSMVKEGAPHESDAWAAFEGEVLPHADRLFRLAMWFERNRAEAEDVVQETMMQALRSFHRFQPGTNCRAWLTTILQRIVSNRRRAKGRSIVVSDPDDRIAHTVPFVPPVPQDLTDELVLSSLQRLSPAFQEVILLCDVEDLSYKEAAKALAIPIGTVMSRLHRGRAQLRSELVAADAVFAGRRPNGEDVNTSHERVEAS